jgi:hypothetical protein
MAILWAEVSLLTRGENYELSLEWKIQPCGNNGVMFNVQEEANHMQA